MPTRDPQAQAHGIKGRDRVGHWLSTPVNRPLSGALGRRPGVQRVGRGANAWSPTLGVPGSDPTGAKTTEDTTGGAGAGAFAVGGIPNHEC